MADAKITELTELTTPVAADVLAIVDDTGGTPTTKKVTMGNLRDNIAVSELADGTEGEVITWDSGGVPTTRLIGIQEIYTGTDFDSDSNTADPDEQSYEMTAIGALTSNYVKVKITGTSIISNAGETAAGSTQVKAQIKEIGGSYADIVSYMTIKGRNKFGSTNTTDTQNCSVEIIAALDSGMKTNGFQIKVFSNSNEGHSTSRARFNNIQTVVELA